MKNKLINATQTAAFPSPECMTFTAKVKYLTDVFLVIMNANWRWFSFLPSTGVPWKPSSGWLLLWMSFISSGDFYLIWVTFNLIRMTFSTRLFLILMRLKLLWWDIKWSWQTFYLVLIKNWHDEMSCHDYDTISSWQDKKIWWWKNIIQARWNVLWRRQKIFWMPLFLYPLMYASTVYTMKYLWSFVVFRYVYTKKIHVIYKSCVPFY